MSQDSAEKILSEGALESGLHRILCVSVSHETGSNGIFYPGTASVAVGEQIFPREARS